MKIIVVFSKTLVDLQPLCIPWIQKTCDVKNMQLINNKIYVDSC